MADVVTETTTSPTSSETTTSATTAEANVETTNTLLGAAEAPVTAPEAKPEDKAAETAPEASIDFTALKVPEGMVLDEATLNEAKPLLEELGIKDTAQAQKLVDFQSKIAEKMAASVRENWNKVNEAWVNEIKADTKFGGDPADPNSNLAKSLQSIASLIDNPQLTPDPKAFRDALGATGFGNNPAAIRTLATWANALTESSKHVQGQPPSAAAGKTAANIMYPNLA